MNVKRTTVLSIGLLGSRAFHFKTIKYFLFNYSLKLAFSYYLENKVNKITKPSLAKTKLACNSYWIFY